MEWAPFIEWAGYDLLGVVLSLFGGVYAYLANRNARRASVVAQKAVENVVAIDAVADIGTMLHRVGQMRLRLEIQDYQRFSENCTDIQIGISKLIKTASINVSGESEKVLGQIKSNAASLARLIDRRIQEDSALDQVKINSMLTKMAEGLTVLQVELKEKVNTDE